MLNSVSYQGRVTRDIEKKQTQSGISFVNFTLAWSEKYKETETKCFLRCKAWRQTAEFIDKYFHNKGSEMLVEGHLETEEWQDADGNNRSQTVLTVNRAHFCGKRQDGGQAAQETPSEAPSGYTDVPDDQLPF
jgi:single-strand DNA-binding protein